MHGSRPVEGGLFRYRRPSSPAVTAVGEAGLHQLCVQCARRRHEVISGAGRVRDVDLLRAESYEPRPTPAAPGLIQTIDGEPSCRAPVSSSKVTFLTSQSGAMDAQMNFEAPMMTLK